MFKLEFNGCGKMLSNQVSSCSSTSTNATRKQHRDITWYEKWITSFVLPPVSYLLSSKCQTKKKTQILTSLWLEMLTWKKATVFCYEAQTSHLSHRQWMQQWWRAWPTWGNQEGVKVTSRGEEPPPCNSSRKLSAAETHGRPSAHLNR